MSDKSSLITSVTAHERATCVVPGPQPIHPNDSPIERARKEGWNAARDLTLFGLRMQFLAPLASPETGAAHDGSMPENHGKKWSLDEEGSLITLWDSGKTIAEMLPVFGRSEGALYSKLAHLKNCLWEDIRSEDRARMSKK